MARIYHEVTELIGRTPLLCAERYAKKRAIEAVLLTKLEALNPAGSAKDRVALAMFLEAEKQGLLRKGTTIVEPTSGNTGIALAALAARKGCRVILTMPETMSEERRNLLKAYGAELVLTDGSKGMAGAVAKAKELVRELPNAFLPDQFANPANPKVHYETTGPEIWEDTGGSVDIFVAGVGTGGTISGVGAYLKEKKPEVCIVAVEPADSPVLSEGRAGTHGLQGIGAGFVPDTLNPGVLDEIITIREEEAFLAGKEFARSEGYLVGISSGAALYAAEVLAARAENKGKTIVALLPDTGERYLSTDLYKD